MKILKIWNTVEN